MVDRQARKAEEADQAAIKLENEKRRIEKEKREASLAKKKA